MENKASGTPKAKTKWRRRQVYVAISFISLFLIFLLLPVPEFHSAESIVVYDREGNLLGARTATDGQWRFPHTHEVPEKFAIAITTFEDKRFLSHPGIDFLALLRAIKDNLEQRRITSGASTLTMQTVRLSRQKPRTYFQKILEIVLSFRLEFSASKNQILALYASNAPFGGNVVGLDAAAWRYFGRPAQQLSWAETATLAVLPNNPALVHTGRNREILLLKRNALLAKLKANNVLDEFSYELAIEEELPHHPFPLPMHSPHLLARIQQNQTLNDGLKSNNFKSTIDIKLQKHVNSIVARHYEQLSQNEIHNLAAIILDVETGEVLAYSGNYSLSKFGAHNDMIMAHRSSGSILKPFLYAAMLSESHLLPSTLVPDIPTRIGGYTPQNFHLNYDGAVPANVALARSLNIPAVRMLQQYGVEKFHHKLQQTGITTLPNNPSHYGLSLILGGGETSLWDLTASYASMARQLKHYIKSQEYNPGSYFPAKLYQGQTPINLRAESTSIYDAASLYLMFNAMVEVVRPGEEAPWRNFSSSQRIAWKTGTSFGFRDAWAIGVSPRYVVGVWAGNASGEGRPGLTGISAAAPVMFEVFNSLPTSEWFEKPYSEMELLKACSHSGLKFGNNCESAEEIYVPRAGMNVPLCHYHKLIHVDVEGKFRVNSSCEPVENIRQEKWFVLPPAQEWYFKNYHPFYRELPPLRADCETSTIKIQAMELIYPRPGTKITIPKELSGERGKAVFEVAHRKAGKSIYWHIDNEFMGATSGFHQFPVQSPPGKYLLTLVDEDGERLEQWFEVQ